MQSVGIVRNMKIGIISAHVGSLNPSVLWYEVQKSVGHTRFRREFLQVNAYLHKKVAKIIIA
jgi:hypothetical protein